MTSQAETCPSCGRAIVNRFRSACFYCGAPLPLPGAAPADRSAPSEPDPRDSGEPLWRFADEAAATPAATPPAATIFDASVLPPTASPAPPPPRFPPPPAGQGRLSAPPVPRPALRPPFPERLPEAPLPEPGLLDHLQRLASGSIGQLVLWTAAAAVLAAMLLRFLPDKKAAGAPPDPSVPAPPKSSVPPSATKTPTRAPDVVITAEGPGEVVRGSGGRFVVRARNREELPVSVVLRRISPIYHDCGRDGGEEIVGWGSSLVVPPGAELVVWNSSPFANPTCPEAAERAIWARQDIDFDLRWTRADRTEDQHPADGSSTVSLQWQIVPPVRTEPGEGSPFGAPERD